MRLTSASASPLSADCSEPSPRMSALRSVPGTPGQPRQVRSPASHRSRGRHSARSPGFQEERLHLLPLPELLRFQNHSASETKEYGGHGPFTSMRRRPFHLSTKFFSTWSQALRLARGTRNVACHSRLGCAPLTLPLGAESVAIFPSAVASSCNS